MNPNFIEVSAAARYWEDTTLNGVEDNDGKIPFRKGSCWCPIINLESGEVLEWPNGLTAKVHYKVCDEGEYWLLDSDKTRVAKWSGDYVPDDILCVGDEGYGDYIIFNINENGFIVGWRKPLIEEDQWEDIK